MAQMFIGFYSLAHLCPQSGSAQQTDGHASQPSKIVIDMVCLLGRYNMTD